MAVVARKVQVIQPIPAVVLNNENMPVTAKRRVAAYCRVSTDSDEQMLSYDAQVSEYRSKIENTEDWQMVDIYADAGISGTNVKNRTAFNRMIADCKAGKIDLIITKSISRFARNTVDCLEHVRKLKHIGVEIFFEKENIYSFDSKMELVLTCFRQSHRKKVVISAKILSGVLKSGCGMVKQLLIATVLWAMIKMKMGT